MGSAPHMVIMPLPVHGGVPASRKYIYDPIHGSISLTGAVLDVVNHPLLQRLWGIRQTGFAHLVFPGAGHSRLEHCLGTMWVARAMSESLGLGRSERQRVELAALMHDIGHPPFSHSLEGPLVEVTGMDHEGWTRKLIQGEAPQGFSGHWESIPGYGERSIGGILETHDIPVREVASLLQEEGEERKSYVREMLHGTIDADRLDYLARDGHYTGVAHGTIDSSRLIETLAVSRGHLAFAEKGRSAVEGFLVARSLMYATVYFNKTVRIAEAMAVSAIERMRGYPESASRLFSMTDGELLGTLEAAGGRSREMARRLRVRALYKRAFTLSESHEPGGASEKLSRDPHLRRQIEDELARAAKGRAGDVLVDVIPHRARPEEDVTLIDQGRTRHLLAEDPSLAHLVRRSPTHWRIAVYAEPRLRERVSDLGEKVLLSYLV